MRHDHTDWLIHFVRDRLPEQDFPGETEEEFNHHVGGELECDASAFQVLETIIRLGGIISGNSFRNGKTTIYGGKPVVCVTEMPLYSLAKYVESRGKSECVSACGIALRKSEFFEAGGRPVIYGLSGSNVTYKVNTPYVRIFNENVLPLEEQYRYVAYSPTKDNWIDWSHEREWRWVANDESEDFIWALNGYDCYDSIPGIPIFSGQENGGNFSEVRIIVWSHAEKEQIQELLTGFYLSGSNNYDTPFSRQLINASSIIVLNDVVEKVEGAKDINAQTIEGLESENLCSPVLLSDPPENAEELVKAAIRKAQDSGIAAAAEYEKSYDINMGSCGFVNATTYAVTHPIVQFMVNNGYASGPFDGRVHIRVPSKWKVTQSMEYEEYIYKAMVPILTAELGVPIFVEWKYD